MVATCRFIRPPPSRLDGRPRRLARDEAVTARADRVLTPRLEQGLPHHEVVLGLEELHEGPLHLPVPQAFCDVNLFPGKGVDAGILKCCGDVAGHPHKDRKIIDIAPDGHYAFTQPSFCPSVMLNRSSR